MTHDSFGPEVVLEVYDPALEMRGFLVVDNTARGPGKGGIRMTPEVSGDEIIRLARTMTWKNAIAEIPFGGAKAGIVSPSDPKKKKQFIQSFARAIKPFVPERYIAGPDVNTGQKEMQWFVETLKDKRGATGKPAKLGGLPHELGSTGYGVAHAVRIALELKNIPLRGARIAIEGFGNVGSFTFQFLQKWGAKIVAVADSKGTAYSESGLDYKVVSKTKAQGKSVSHSPNSQNMPREAIFSVNTDVLIPATVTDVINKSNRDEIKAPIIVEGANIPMDVETEEILSERGILVVPDFVANAGGVISSFAEYQNYSESKMFTLVENKISKVAQTILSVAIKRRCNPRTVALEIAQERVRKSMG